MLIPGFALAALLYAQPAIPTAPAGETAAPAPAPAAPAAPGATGTGAATAAPTAAPVPDEERPASCLEELPDGPRRKGVQRRDFLKKMRGEVAALGGLYASDVLSSTYLWGGAVSFFLAEDFGVEALVTRSRVEFKLEQPFSGFDREQHFTPGSAWQAVGALLYSPIHAKFKWSDEAIVHGDVFLLAGAGRTAHDTVQGLTWQAGIGLKLYLARFVDLRIDLRDFVMPQEVLGRGRISNNVGVMAGVGVWTP